MKPKPHVSCRRLPEPAFGDVLQSIFDGFVQDVLEKAEGAATEAALEAKRRMERELAKVTKSLKISKTKLEE